MVRRTLPSGVGAAPGFEAAVVVFVLFVEGDVTERLVGDEFLFFWVFAGEVEVGVPGAGVEIDLVAAALVVIEGDGFLMMGVSVNDVARRVVLKGGFLEGKFGEGAVAAEEPPVLQFVDEVVEGFERDEFGDFDCRLHFIHDVNAEGDVFAADELEVDEFFGEVIPDFFELAFVPAVDHVFVGEAFDLPGDPQRGRQRRADVGDVAQVVHNLGVEFGCAFEFFGVAVADFHGEGVAEGGVVASQFDVEVEGVKGIAVAAKDLVFTEEPLDVGRFVLFPWAAGVNLPQVVGEGSGRVA